jgi:hypothetical protein
MEFENYFLLGFNLLSKLITYVLPFKYVFHCVDSPIKTWTKGVENKIQKL